MYVCLTLLLPRTVGFCYSLKYELDNLKEAWNFLKKDNGESDDEEDEDEASVVVELSVDQIGKANTAIQAHMLIIAEIKKKVNDELFMAETAGTVGWGAVSVLENKNFTKITGSSETDKELKMQQVRKANEIFRKEQNLNKKMEKRPRKRLGFQKAKPYGGFANGGYYQGAGTGYGRGGYGQIHDGAGYSGGGGRGYGGRGAGGARGGGARPGRTCHRCVVTKLLEENKNHLEHALSRAF